MGLRVVSKQGSRSGVAPSWQAVVRFALDNGIVLALLVTLAFFSLAAPEIFFTSANLVTVLRLASLGGILVACYSCALIAGQVDLSTPFVGGLAAVSFAALLQSDRVTWGVALVLALLVAAAAGWLSSWLITGVGVPAIIATLAVGALCYGVAYLMVDQYGQSGVLRIAPAMRTLVNTTFAGLPLSVYLMVLIYAAVYIVLGHTRLGAHLYALGGNVQAARLNGIATRRLVSVVLIATAVSSGLASILLSGRQMAAGPLISALGASSSGSLAAPASPLVAALFAGVSLAGGEGRVIRTLFGVLFLAVLAVGMAILNLPAYLRLTIEGLVFVVAILLDSVRQRLETR